MFGEDFRQPVVIEAPQAGDDWGAIERLDFNVEGSAARARFREFFRNFRQDSVFIYRDALMRHWNRREMFVDVDLAHLNQFDEVLFNNLQARPDEILPLFELAAKDALKQSLTQQSLTLLNETKEEFQIVFHSNQETQSLRTLTAEHVNTLIKVPGIVISCSKTRSKAVSVCVKCTKCQNVKRLLCRSAMGGVSIPAKCDRNGQPGDPCGTGTFTVMSDQCEYIDQQTLKLQEAPEVVPTGEMPRQIMLTVDRFLVDRVTPGTRCAVIGVVSLFQPSSGAKKSALGNGVRTPYLRVLGIEIESEGGRGHTIFTPQEEEELQRLARDPEIYEKFARSIAPQISGEYTRDIKKALACLLMGGSRKVLPDGVRLRGDINVLLMGDPSTAKSQFLKFIEKVAPIGVYTSGKGSSAAGLTASVIKDSKGEFFLEGGAMVLADGGVICIDEFDKMRETDRVAIHEAMEQQTISVAKAGITTMLNCRNSVLAAANPIHGRYDDMRDVGDNINLMSTILSRFDCIFIVRDVREVERDKEIARHVLGVHVSNSLAQTSNVVQPDIPPALMKKFVMYCRERCAPRLSEEAAALLGGQYVHIRNQVREAVANRPGEAQVVPITIRQLEAITRIAEALAKMRLCAEASVSDVEEALRLFKVSTLAASQSNPALMNTVQGRDVELVEEYFKRRLGLRSTVSKKTIVEEAHMQGFSIDVIRTAIRAMIVRKELEELRQGQVLKRIH